MAVANTKSKIVSDGDSTSYAMHDSREGGGVLREQVATVETLAADSAESLYRLFRVPSNARISSIEIGHDAITGMSTADLGVWQTNANGDAVVDANLFASAFDVSSAGALTDRTYEATATNIASIDKMLWELMGLSEDPLREYDIGIIATTNAPSAAGTISGRLRYVVN